MKPLPVLLLLSLTGCIVTNPREDATARKEAEAARRSAVRAENRQREAESTAAIRARHDALGAQQQASNEKAHTDREEANRPDCEGAKEAREAFHSARDHKYELQEWENTHCKWVDRSTPVTRRVQDSRGEWHLVEGRSEGTKRECNAPLPKDLLHISAGDIFIPQPTYDIRCDHL